MQMAFGYYCSSIKFMCDFYYNYLCMKVLYMKENITLSITGLQELIDTIGTLQTAWGLIVAFFIIIVFVVCVLAFRYNVNNASKAQIRKFEKEGKYLPSVYVELHSTMENLRYFVFSYKWKQRIIKQYNHLFESYEGARLKKNIWTRYDI